MKLKFGSTLVVALAALVALLAGRQADAATISLDPSLITLTGTGASNCEPGCVETAFGLTPGSLTLYYKGDVGNPDSGTFASSYDTVFANTATDPADATISYVGGPVISCPECYLAVKDGNQDPSYYFYDIGQTSPPGVPGTPWDGLMDIILTNFWPGPGAISHVSIWGATPTSTGTPGPGGPGTVGEPGTLLLVGIGLGLGVRRMRRKQEA